MASIETTRAVVGEEETYDGKIIPAVEAELQRSVRVQNEATVEGSVYGASVETDPGATVQGSVMASEAIEMNGGHIHGEVGTPGKVVAENARVDGTVTGKRVRLAGCVVRGNVVGTEVILENCVVLGIVAAERHLTIEQSLCYTFRAHEEASLEHTIVILPQAVVDGGLTLETPVSVAGLGLLDVADHDDGNSERPPEMTREDLHQSNGTTYLTLAPRILDLEKVTDRLNELEMRIMDIVEDTTGEGPPEMSVEHVLDVLDVDVAGIGGVGGE